MDSRPKISWAELAGTNVGIWGLGVEGKASVRRARRQGASVVVVDDHPMPPLDGIPVVRTSEGGLEALARCDVVIKTPGISRYRPEVAALTARGVPVVGALGLWLEGQALDRVIAVTGTKGKSTTASIIGHLLNRTGHRCQVAGNIGVPPYDPDVQEHPDFWVVEVSSFQATDLASSPPVTVVTSLSPDHLDWHGDVETYYRDKLSMCRQPGADLTVANGDSTELRARRDQLGPRVEWVSAQRTSERLADEWSEPLGLVGAHNRRNARIARAVLRALGIPAATDDAMLAEACRGFVGLESRLEFVGRVGGVDFVNDSLSTNVLSALAALDAFADRPVALIVGGMDRGIDYGELGHAIAQRREPTLVVTLPDSGKRVHAAITDHAGAAEVIDCSGMAEAVNEAFAWSRPGGAVVLSPAAPSFGRFRDYRERARAFAEAMAECARSLRSRAAEPLD